MRHLKFYYKECNSARYSLNKKKKKLRRGKDEITVFVVSLINILLTPLTEISIFYNKFIKKQTLIIVIVIMLFDCKIATKMYITS